MRGGKGFKARHRDAHEGIIRKRADAVLADLDWGFLRLGESARLHAPTSSTASAYSHTAGALASAAAASSSPLRHSAVGAPPPGGTAASPAASACRRQSSSSAAALDVAAARISGSCHAHHCAALSPRLQFSWSSAAP